MSRLASFLFIATVLLVIVGATRASPEPYLIYLAVISDGAPGSLSIADLSDNRSDYLGGQIPKYEKLEITFQILNSVAQNFQLPYDPNPPFGIDPTNYPLHKGISIDAHFLPPGETNWDDAYVQPGFYYRYYDYDVKDDRDWFVPKNKADWKVRFSPHHPGPWQYKLKVRDASGEYETSASKRSVKLIQRILNMTMGQCFMV
jgi:hypothetical protein